jgi:hypothetical protein
MIIREDNVKLNLVLTVVLLAVSVDAFAGDVVPFFRPDPKPVPYGPALPDPEVPECAANDRACLDAYDGRVRDVAIYAGDRSWCDKATHPDECRAVFDMTVGDVTLKRPAILDDPCAWVVMVKDGVAVVTSQKLGRTQRLPERWGLTTKPLKALTFVGTCDLAKYRQAHPEAPIPMPQWVVPPAPPAKRQFATVQVRR